MLNKKGMATHLLYMVLYMLGIMAFLVLITYLVQNSIALSASTHHLEHYLLFNRIIYSKDSVFYYDKSIDRVYLGVVDQDRFYEDVLRELFRENMDFGVKLSIGEQDPYEIFYNKEIYEAGRYVFELRGSVYGGLRYTYPVIDKDGKNTILLMGLMYRE